MSSQTHPAFRHRTTVGSIVFAFGPPPTCRVALPRFPARHRTAQPLIGSATLACGQAMGIPFDCLYGIDPKESAFKFCKNNFLPQHWFYNIEDALKGAAACRCHHDAKYNVPKIEGGLDIMIIGFPCAPFSRMRCKSKTGSLSLASYAYVY